MSMVALRNTWRGGKGPGLSGMSPGEVVRVGANYGTQGSLAQWQGRTYTAQNRTPFTPDPMLVLFNKLGPALWHQSVNNTKSMPHATSTPTANVVYTVPNPAALSK